MKLLIIGMICTKLVQTDTLPTTADLFKSLKEFHNKYIQASTQEFTITEKNAWMKWTPNIGIQYNLQGKPRPAISFNLSQVYTNLNAKEVTKAKIASIRLSADLGYRNDSLMLVSLLSRLTVLKSATVTLEAENRIDDEIWEIQKEKYRLKQITPIDYLIIKREYLERGERYKKAVMDIELLEIEILRLSKA
jgi:hypothetical protein